MHGVRIFVDQEGEASKEVYDALHASHQRLPGRRGPGGTLSRRKSCNTINNFFSS